MALGGGWIFYLHQNTHFGVYKLSLARAIAYPILSNLFTNHNNVYTVM